MIRAEVHFSKNSFGTISVYDKTENQVEQVEFNIPWDLPDDQVRPVELSTSGATFRSFFISGVCQIIRICGVTEGDFEIFQNNAAISSHLQTSVEENWGQHTAALLHPNKYYRLQVETSASRRKNGGDWTERNFIEYIYFKTGNPPGQPSELQLAAGDDRRYDLQEPLKDLGAYIDHTIPAGAAANEPQWRVYRSYDIGVVYNDLYIDQMYQMAGLPVILRLKDNNNLPVLGPDGAELEFVNSWGDNPELCETREETQYKDILDANNCFVLSVQVTSENKNELVAASRDLLLLPQIQYRAQLFAGEAFQVYEFAFITSHFANFLHHMHSFANIVWDHFTLVADAEFTIDPSGLAQILSGSETEPVMFEQLMALFDLNPRSLPEQIEVTLVDDIAQSYGLLFESPEPIDWDRFEISLAMADKTNQVEEFDQKIKIIDASIINTGTDLNNQWVDILVLELTDLSGYKLEYLDAPEMETGTYQEFYVFQDNPKYLAGTLLRVYNGADMAIPPDEIEFQPLYASHPSQSFEPAGAVIRVKTEGGEILHTRCIYRERAFADLDAHIIRNADGTRFFVFIRDGTQEFTNLRAGMYRMRLTYKRDIGPDAPLLKRFGLSDPEVTYIEFSLPACMPPPMG